MSSSGNTPLKPEDITRLPVSRCPRCRYTMDAATSATRRHATPTPGDYSVCLACAAILRFADDLTLRACSVDEQRELERADPELAKQLGRIVQFCRRLPRRQ